MGVAVILMNLLFASKLPFSNLHDRIVLIITAWDSEVTGTAFDTSMIPSTWHAVARTKRQCTHVTSSCNCGRMPGYAAVAAASTFYRTYRHQVTQGQQRDERPKNPVHGAIKRQNASR